MKHLVPALLVGFLSCATAAEPLPPVPAASAPAIAQPARPAASAAPQSPAVKAAQKAIVPGKVRPEKPIVPQVVLSRPASNKNSLDALPNPGPARDTIDERAARCAAQQSQSERQRCEATR